MARLARLWRERSDMAIQLDFKGRVLEMFRGKKPLMRSANGQILISPLRLIASGIGVGVC